MNFLLVQVLQLMRHKQAIDTFVGEDLLKFKEIWAAAGTSNAVFQLASKDLESVTGGKIILIK